MNYKPLESRYDTMKFNRCGNSGIKIPAISLGLWHNWGDIDVYENGREMVLRAFDLGITHFDLANNYGPPPGSAEKNFGKILQKDLYSYRDELIISTKAGWDMWRGPYGNYGSRKYLIASINQSLNRLGLDYVDIFYSHRPDPDTPMEETMGALDYIVRSGKALYVGISQYNAEQTKSAIKILNALGTPCLIHQPKYNMFDRWIENELLDVLDESKTGCIVFSPLAQGLLTNKYINEIPADSRAAMSHGFLERKDITEEKLKKIRLLNELAQSRNQTLAQMAIVWVLRDSRINSALIGSSKISQIEEIVRTLDRLELSKDELTRIENILNE